MEAKFKSMAFIDGTAKFKRKKLFSLIFYFCQKLQINY